MRTPRPRKHRVVSEVTKMSECWKYTSHAGGLPDAPPRPAQLPRPRTARTASPQELLCFPNCLGGGYRRFPVWAREKALKEGRRKEQPAATKGFKGLGPLPNRLPQTSAPAGPGLPAPPPPCGQGHSSSASLRERWAARARDAASPAALGRATQGASLGTRLPLAQPLQAAG